jgi:hypothetical protein
MGADWERIRIPSAAQIVQVEVTLPWVIVHVRL